MTSNNIIKKPNFFIVGATKSGTTSLHEYLTQHQDIYMSPKKEPHFFSFGNIDINFKGPGDMLVCKDMMVLNESNYLDIFQDATNQKILGESSAMYLHIPGTAKNIFEFNPTAKILILLRNPIDRAYSAFMHLTRDGRENLDFNSAINEEKRRLESGWMPFWGYIKQGFYYSQVKEYLDVFSKEQVEIYLYEDFFSDLDNSISKVFDFLDVNKIEVQTKFKENVSGIPKNRFLHNLIKNPNGIIKKSYSIIPKKFRKIAKSKINNFNLNKGLEIDKSTRIKLTNMYKNDIELLENLIDKNLQHWLK
jgi:hypothetical protein